MKHKQTPHPLRRACSRGLALLGAIATMTSTLADPPPPHGIVAAQIGVQQIGPGNAAADVVVTNALAVNDFRIRPTANRGDFDVQIGPDFTDDVLGGVLITSISEHTRDQGDSAQLIGVAPNQVPGYTAGPHVATAHFEAQAGGSYFIPIAFTLANTIDTAVIEFNMNVAAAWFPYDKYLGAYIRNATAVNGGVNDTMIGSPGLVVGTHFVDNGGGNSTVNLTNLNINANTDGVLLVLGAKNEDNYALSRVNADGTWSLFSKDNGTDTTALERDPMAFVYIPKTNQYLVSGRFDGDAQILLSSGTTPQFTITTVDIGRWELKIPTGSPDKGVLIISPEGGLPLNRDNIVTYQANDARDGWIIESRDLVNTAANSLPALETPTGEPVASFVYIPGSTPGVIVSPTNQVFTTESAGTGTFTVMLETKPKADVTIALTSSNTAEGTVSPASITFTTNDWNIAQTITITGVDDPSIDGFSTNNIILAAAVSTDLEYNGINPADVEFINIDNEGGITIAPTGGLVTTEAGGTATFTVRLTQAPVGAATVTIPLTSSDLTEGTVSPASLVFDSTTWNVEQTVTITGADDSIDEGDIDYTIITEAATSTDPFYSGRASADVSVRNTDNDVSGVTVTPTTGLTFLETAGTTLYSVVLNAEPTANVVINVTSGDTSEATISPATLTFTPVNWLNPQDVLITGVDDLVADGNIRFVITNTLTSTDLLYTNIEPADVTVTSLDEDAALTLPTPSVFWGIGMPPVSLATRATVSDTNTPSYDASTLRAAITAGVATDRLEIRNIGAADGQIGVSGNTVSFSGVDVGTFTGGSGATPLVVTFNGNSTPAAAQALIRALTFHDSATAPTNSSRAFTLTLTDTSGAVATATGSISVGLLRVTDFQEGVDSGYGLYTGAKDIELNQANPDALYPTGRNANGLLMDPTDEATPNAGHVLLRFDNLVGAAANQIPTNSIIVSAELFFDVNDTGDGSPLYRMLIAWDADNSTWNSVGGGMFPDDTRARTAFDSQIGVSNGTGATTVGQVWVSVTPDVDAWVNGGATNFGWVMPGWEAPAGSINRDGTFISASEAANLLDRPRLRVSWLPKDSASVASFRQGVNDYTGAVDTRIREVTPDTDFSAIGSVFVDAIVDTTVGVPNMEQVLLRFDNIIGSGPGQIPTGSRIESAILDLSSLNGDAMGDGGQFFQILSPWPEVGTWNGWTNGVDTNGVEAAASPTVLAGSPALDPDVQGGYLSFDLTSDVRSWVSGATTNNGWVLIPWPGGGNGWGFFTSENGVESNRPRLRVFYVASDTPPTDIELQNPVVTASSVTLNFTGTPSASFSIYRATAVDGAFTKIGDATTGANGSGTFTDNAPPTNGAFYRIGTP